MRLITRFELAQHSDSELSALFREASQSHSFFPGLAGAFLLLLLGKILRTAARAAVKVR